MINVFRRAGLGAKLSLLTGVSVATLFLLFTFLLSQKASQQLEALAVEDLHNQSTGMVDMVQMFNTSLSEEVPAQREWRAGDGHRAGYRQPGLCRRQQRGSLPRTGAAVWQTLYHPVSAG